MQLKKYEAPTIQEALRRVKAELGDDAFIFSSRTISPKFNSAKRPGSKWVEVTAAVDRNSNNRLQTGLDNSIINSVVLDGNVKKEKYMEIGGNVVFNSKVSSLTSKFFPYMKQLLVSGFDQDIAWYLIGEASAEYNIGNNRNSIYNILLQKIAYHIPVEGSISVNPNRRKVVALIGSTGVGKTTTLAKIAAHCSIMKGIKVKILTMDTYRIAAVEQLRIYGKIMDLPVFVASTQNELEREIEIQDDANLILIDTAGRNYRDSEQVAGVSRWLHKYKEIESHLLLCATTSEDVINLVIKCFSKSRVDRIIITKTDESIGLGHLYNPIVSAKIPISYITTGQRVPEDIKSASSQTLSGIFLKGFGN